MWGLVGAMAVVPVPALGPLLAARSRCRPAACLARACGCRVGQLTIFELTIFVCLLAGPGLPFVELIQALKVASSTSPVAWACGWRFFGARARRPGGRAAGAEELLL